MTRAALRVYVDADDIARLETVARQLPQNQRVQITLDDGSQMLGVVGAMPSMQAFFDPEGREGMNALVRIEIEGMQIDGDSNRDLWLDRIVQVTSLPNPSAPQASRAWPPDPNAPTAE